MITLTLLHPVQGTAVQSWTFRQDQTVRIGRAVDNEVVLYSAVVSRYHVELRYENRNWYVHNLGINGTFIEGRKIESEVLDDGKAFRLARSGPNIQVSIESHQHEASSMDRSKPVQDPPPSKGTPQGTQVEPWISGVDESIEKKDPDEAQKQDVDQEQVCNHERSPKSSLICIDCGEPMKILRTIGAYKVLKSLGDHDTTFQAWKNKKTYILRTAPLEIFSDSVQSEAYHRHLTEAAQLNHGGIPRIIEVLDFEGRPYLVYEMIYGMSLESWVHDRGSLSLPLAISWITEIARVLEYLHQLDPPFIHQGVKPSNIIRPTIPQGNNHLMLVNFGQMDGLLAKSDRSESDLAYRTPNLPLGEISIELDLYGLGATFLFMLTGADPYKYIQLGDKAYTLRVEETIQMPKKVWNLIGGLLKTQDSVAITTVTEAIDYFIHLI